MNNTGKYYELVVSDDPLAVTIKWNTDIICNSSSGFIVQHMKIMSSVSAVGNDDYYEAWVVNNYSIDYDDEGVKEPAYDDEWLPIPACYLLDVVDNDDMGVIRYASDVFYIPSKEPEYDDVLQWPVVPASPARQLKYCEQYTRDISQYYCCSRYNKWDYKEILREHKRH